jgi:hypothetical protein
MLRTNIGTNVAAITDTRRVQPGISLSRRRPGELASWRDDGSQCDGRVNFRGMWGHVGLRKDTSVGEIPVDLAALFQGN